MSDERPTGRTLPSLSLEGRRALVTGSGTGLGKMIALGLAQAGAGVVLVGRRRAKLDETAGLIRELGGEATPVTADITSET